MRESDFAKLYDEGRELLLNGKLDEARERFMRIYALNCSFRDVAGIVEDSYDLPEDEWRRKFQTRFTTGNGAA